MNIQRYSAADLPTLFDKISKNSIGMDEYFDSFWNATTSNYPPYNLIHESNVLSRLEIALAGFKRDEVKVYTEYGKLVVEAEKEEKTETGSYAHKGIAARSFSKQWSLSDDTEIGDVTLEDGLLTVTLKKVVPEHHARKDYI
jgi:molecular chaperone IbpA